MTDPLSEPPFISTGALPPNQRIDALLEQTYAQLNGVEDGAVSTVYPALAAASPRLFGLCVVGVDGVEHAAGDADVTFHDHERVEAVRVRARVRRPRSRRST